MNKLKEIALAYTNSVDKEQEYYKYRKSVCNGCEFNTANMKDSDKSTLNRALETFSSTDRCNACGCPIDRKCGSKASYCGLKGEIIKGKMIEPKWTPVEIDMRGNSFIITNLMPSETDTEKVNKDTVSVRVREYGDLIKARLRLVNLNGAKVTMLKDASVDTLIIANKHQETDYDCSVELSFRKEDLVEGDNIIECGIMYMDMNRATRRLNVILKVTK